MVNIRIKRVYEEPSKLDGFRILVDRLWPRGLKKEELKMNAWMKEVSPSPALRKWFNHEEPKWNGFKTTYQSELNDAAAMDELIQYCLLNKTVTLLYAAKDQEHNHALVLRDFLRSVISEIEGNSRSAKHQLPKKTST